jgi:hypothetical protein
VKLLTIVIESAGGCKCAPIAPLAPSLPGPLRVQIAGMGDVVVDTLRDAIDLGGLKAQVR